MSKCNSEQDFWPKVDKISNPNGCWIWTAGKHPQGYGMFAYQGEKYAHRASLKIIGQDPKGWDVLHKCDNPSCVNPKHLVLGTHTDNMRDMVSKNRHVPHGRGGPRKFNDDQIKEIRTSLDEIKNIAKKFNTTVKTIKNIKKCRSYKDVI